VTTFWDQVRGTWLEAESAVEIPRDWRDLDSGARRLWLLRGSSPIAITGMPGAGKTVLFDALMNRIDTEYVAPGKSSTGERHRVLLRTPQQRTRASVIVVPGQISEERNTLLAKIFADGNSPAGVIHVVCWGFNEAWSGSSDGLVEELQPSSDRDVDELLRLRRVAELKDFRDLRLRLTHRSVQRKLKWMIILVTKSDLFWSDIGATRDYYIPRAPGAVEPFGEELRRLTSDHGGFPERLAIIPFSSLPDNHSFANELSPRGSQLDRLQRKALRNNFFTVLVSPDTFCFKLPP